MRESPEDLAVSPSKRFLVENFICAGRPRNWQVTEGGIGVNRVRFPACWPDLLENARKPALFLASGIAIFDAAGKWVLAEWGRHSVP